MWAALLAGNLSNLQALTGIETGKQGRAHGDRLRHQLLRVPARVILHARRLTLRLPPGHDLLPKVMAELRALPAPSGRTPKNPFQRPGTGNRRPGGDTPGAQPRPHPKRRQRSPGHQEIKSSRALLADSGQICEYVAVAADRTASRDCSASLTLSNATTIRLSGFTV